MKPDIPFSVEFGRELMHSETTVFVVFAFSYFGPAGYVSRILRAAIFG
jgi:hypothetical protein